MARDAVTITTADRNTGAANPTATTINVTNGCTIAAADDLDRLLLIFTNTHTSTHVMTVAAGANPPAFRAGIGAVTLSVPASGVGYLTIESARCDQADGSLSVDFDTGTTGTLACIKYGR